MTGFGDQSSTLPSHTPTLHGSDYSNSRRETQRWNPDAFCDVHYAGDGQHEKQNITELLKKTLFRQIARDSHVLHYLLPEELSLIHI